MPTILLTIVVSIEPDLQRLSRFILDAVAALGGNIFPTAAKLDGLLRLLREAGVAQGQPVKVDLILESQKLKANFLSRAEALAVIDQVASEADVIALSQRLSRASESSDPELLLRRNIEINKYLEKARSDAAAEMAQLEATLAKKKLDLVEMIQKAETDQLTGLLNRRAYDDRLDKAFLRSMRQSEPLSLILFDLDYFKQINDTHGHQYGDAHLQKMAQAIKSAIRQDVDHACRIGGDEFVILVFANEDIAHRIGKKVLDAMDGKVSIGIAQLVAQDGVTAQLVARADAAMYQAKKRGRGQIALASETILGAPAKLEAS